MDTVSGRGSSGALSSSADSITGGHSMHHSLSTPAGVDGGVRTPPATPKKGGKMLAIRVQMLDDTVTIFQIQAKALGRVLFEQVCNQLHLLEVDYFGLEYSDANRTKYWLDLEKPISRQLGLSLVDPLLYFCVKFYTPDPAQLEEEYTRYFFCLQVKRDLAQGIMQCNENTAALMASYIVQAECGDYVPEDYPDHTYLSSYKFVPQQDREMEKKIMENHKRHAGQSPEVADLNLLETARRCELYGVKMHPAKDHENVALNLAVAHMGILVFQNYMKINTFSWAKIRKISFKRKKFLIKLHPEGYGCYKDTVEFFFEGRNECKNFWKKCVENHGFFRCSSVKHVSRHKTRVLSRGSSFRYSGKTQKEIVEFVRENYVKRQTFQRSHSFRHSSAHSSASNMHTSTVGNSISAHPLLPLADSSLSAEASKLSASLGSMGAAAGRGTAHARPVSPTTKSASHPRDTATSWSSAPDTIATSTKPSVMVPRPPPVVPTTSSPSPTETRSASDASSATASPLAGSPDRNRATPTSAATANRKPASPLAVRAAVHRADTDITTTRTRITSRTPSSHKSEGSLDHHHHHHQYQANASSSSTGAATHHYALSQTQSQNDLMGGGTSSRPHSPSGRAEAAAIAAVDFSAAAPKRQLWRRSASCRDLYDFSFEETGRAKRRAKSPRPLEKAAISLDERKQQDSPVTVYDDHHAFYHASSRDSSLEIQQDIMLVSSARSFATPTSAGTASYSQESVEDPGNYELRDSQEDLSHDSYELIEKSDDSTSCSGSRKLAERKKPFFNTRSCSLDSGNYLPSDSESDERAGTRQKYKSVSDHDIFLMEDPRDLPREIVPRKSDGSFYKHFRHGGGGSRTSSVESKSDYYETRTVRGVGSRSSSQESEGARKPPLKKNKSDDNFEYYESRTSSMESKSEYFDASVQLKRGGGGGGCGDFDRKINFERNYGTQRHRQSLPEPVLPHYSDYSTNGFEAIYPGGVYSVETEQSMRVGKILSDIEQNTLPIAEMIPCRQPEPPSPVPKNTPPPPPTHIWPENIVGLPTTISSTGRSTESESNIFSFDEDRIQSLQEGSDFSDRGFGVVPNIDSKSKKRGEVRSYRDVFMEIEPRRCHDLPLHQPIERTKSDPNSLARQRLNSSARRLLLMHQKSIDLTPAESSDEDYLYKQIPSAPPITKFKGTHFEMPIAEFGHFDILKREMEGQKTKFEVPKSQFEVLGAKDQADLINLPPKGDDIPYVLHKRHVMNGTAQKEDASNGATSNAIEPDALKPETSFLFTQNIDLSKVNPVTLEVEKSLPAVQLLSSPKRDITHIDPLVLETLNSKLSQIESDSPTSSRTESLKPIQRVILKQDQAKVPKIDERPQTVPKMDVVVKPKIPEKIKTDIKPKRVIKPRMQPGKKSGKTNKTKVRITSFSSDDESLDSDDVFGSAEATPTKMEFSPPQMRKEMESILKFESERKYLPYTMSSTEVEGSPPTTRRKTDKYADSGLDPLAAQQQTELRRISERSLSIPSSEDEFNNIKVSDLAPVFAEPPDLLKTVEEADKEDGDKSLDETLKDDQGTDNELTTIDDEREREKALLQAEIENDLKNLKVPSKTKITEIRGKGPSPLLFAHARLNLSEGSAFSLLQKQQAVDSPLPNRRARSLDAPIIPVNKLPPLNAFSSKDDTVEEEEENETRRLQKSFISTTSTEVSDAENGHGLVPDQAPPPPFRPAEIVKKGSLGENDQIVPDVTVNKKKSPPNTKPTPNLPPKGVVPAKPKEALGKKPQVYSKERPRMAKRSSKPLVDSKPKEDKVCAKPPLGPKSSSTESKANNKNPSHRLLTEKAASAEGESKSDDDRSRFTKAKSFSAQSSLTLPEIKRTKSQEMEPNRRAAPKEKARSLEKLELRRLGSKERTRSQEESEEVIAERRKLQQMLYETAIKQTKTLKSPVKDILPVFPQVEETVRERGGKLEISINTIEPTVSLEEAIIVTKSPKKLDKKLDKKLTKSLELNLNDDADRNVQRMGKSLDLERSKSEDEADKSTEFDFKPETIESINARDKLVEDISPDVGAVKETVTAVVHHSEPSREDHVILEGTSLDVWLSVAEKKLEDIEVIKDGGDFFEQRTSPKPPDLCKIDNKSKSSSDSASLERVSLGNSLDIKYIDESADSSCKSEKDQELIAEMQRASATVSKFIRRRLEKKRKSSEDSTIVGETPVRITSEDESLTEVSDLKPEERESDKSLLTVTVTDHKDALLKLSIERSKSEDTGSWMTVECEEYVGAESSLDYDNAAFESPDKPLEATENDSNLLGAADAKQIKKKLTKRGSDHSKSSDTGSWTSGEKELNVKETDESSVSCSMGRAIGLSQNIEMFATKDQLEKVSSHSSDEQPKSPRSPRICVLGRAFTIDEGSQKLDESSSDEANEIPKDLAPIEETHKESTDSDNGKSRKPYPFEEKWSQDSELGQKLHKKLSKKLSSAEKGSFSSLDDAHSFGKRATLDKPNLLAVEKLSTESRNSLDTESSSGSLGIATRAQKSGDIPRELSSSWKPFPLDSSGSESFDDNLLPPDHDLERHDYFLCRDNSGDFASMTDVHYKSTDVTPTRDDTELPEDLANFPTNFGYPCITSLAGATDMLAGYTSGGGGGGGGGFLSRTLSRISERSTNSEKSSLEEDVTKASTQSDSLNDESMASSNPQVSVSSESPSHAHVYDEKKTPTNEKPSSVGSSSGNRPPTDPMPPHFSSLLQRQISDDRRTSAEMAELSMDDIEIITSERGLRLRRQGSDDTIIDEECFEDAQRIDKQSSQESEDWPLPEIPTAQAHQRTLLAMHELPSSDTSAQLTTQVYQPPAIKSIPKTFGLKGSLKSQDSHEQWPSPPSSVIEPIVENVESYYVSPAEEAYRVNIVESSTYEENDSNSDEYRTIEDIEQAHTYENVIALEHVCESLSDSQSASVGPSGIKIVLEERGQDSNSDEDLNISNLIDDVFVDESVPPMRGSGSEQLRPPTVVRRSISDGSRSSYSEDDCTSSLGTNLEDGTVRFALKPTKCTHSSHSEDTSIALSLSEWSNSTTTVKFQNLSSSGTTKSSSGLKSDENSLTDIAQSISEWSTTQSSTLKAQQQQQQQYQKLTNTTTSTGDSNTLTDLIPSISDWSSAQPQPQPSHSAAPTRLGSSIDIEDVLPDQRSPKNIPSEDFSIFSSAKATPDKSFTKSTERPMVIPVQVLSDTDKSSGSLVEPAQPRYEKDKKGYLQQKYHSVGGGNVVVIKSTDRPVKVNLKLAKCSPYYSSSLSSESTPLAGTSPSKTATVPLTRIHKRPVSRSLTHAKSPPSENDSTSSVESPKSKSERERRGYRRKRQLQQQRNKAKNEKELQYTVGIDEFYYVENEHGLTEYNEYIRERNMEEMASNFQFESVLSDEGQRPVPRFRGDRLEEGYYPDVDSQSGSDIFRMEREDEDKPEPVSEGFDVSSIPPPLLLEDDDFGGGPIHHI